MQLPEDIVWRLILSIIIGGVIGAEREYRSKSAGFRTLTLICLGATLFTIFSQMIGARTAPERIASNVVVGIGFVGAGVIFKGSDNRVNGITTAAMIWVTAALGMGIGAGYALISILACLLVMAVLFVFNMLEERINSLNQIRQYRIVCDYQDEALHRYEQSFREHHLRFKRDKEMKAGDLFTGEWIVQGSEKNHRHFIHTILNDPSVKSFEF